MATEDVIPRPSDQAGTRLRAGAIGLAGATMQAGSTAALIYVTIRSFQPLPSFPHNLAPLIDVSGSPSGWVWVFHA